jgi:hypothetical protein
MGETGASRKEENFNPRSVRTRRGLIQRLRRARNEPDPLKILLRILLGKETSSQAGREPGTLGALHLVVAQKDRSVLC